MNFSEVCFDGNLKNEHLHRIVIADVEPREGT
jgi:hypothetical protein